MLLHIGDPLVQRTFDPWVAIAALLLFSVAALAIWVPHTARRRVARRVASFSVTIAVGLALLPTVLPYDHLFLPELAHNDGSQVHQDHCHGDAGSCSDAPVSSGAGQFLTTEPLLPTPALTALLLIAVAGTLTGVRFRPNLRPPTSVLVTS